MSLLDGMLEAYEFYNIVNFGNLSQEDFNRFYPRAASFVSSMTMGKSENVTDKSLLERVRLAIFTVMEDMYNSAQNDGSGPVMSESNDGISVTYAASKDSRTNEERQRKSASPYLAGTGLLYRGVCFRC